MVKTQALGDFGWRFILRPNCSASWRQVKIFMALISAVCLAIAGTFASLGFWPILPFAGAELALLGYALWLTSHRSSRTEVVDVAEHTVEVEKGAQRPQTRWCFQRAWAKVFLVPAPIARHPSRLFIGSHGQRVDLGGFLTEGERLRLARDLSHAMTGAHIEMQKEDNHETWSPDS